MLTFLLFAVVVGLGALSFFIYKDKVELTTSYQAVLEKLAIKAADLSNLESKFDETVQRSVAGFKENLETRHQAKYEALANSIPQMIETARDDANNRQRAIIKGFISEQLCPFLPNFPYESSDCLFIGKPFDILVMNGLSAGEVKQIILMDIKTGFSQLTERQKQIKACVDAGRVKFEKLFVGDDFSIEIK